MLTKDEKLVKKIKENYEDATIPKNIKVMLDYAVKLTIKPTSVSNDDIIVLRNNGFSDRAILDICQIASYFNFVNRMAEGLGVELESE